MKLRAIVSAALTLALSLALSAPTRADHHHGRVVEAGPEDGALCCSGLIPFLFHDGKVLTATGRAGIFRSADRGERWRRSMNGLIGPNGVSGFVDNICQAPSDPRIVYALAGATNPAFSGFNGLFLSEDLGETWTRRTALEALFPACAVDADNPRTVYISDLASPGHWISRDGGETVQDFPVPACAAEGTVYPRHGILYVRGGPGCTYVSTDGGVSFSAVAEPLAFGSNLNVSPDGRALFISTFDSSFNPTGTFRSTDRGASYVAVSGLPNVILNTQLAFEPNSSRIYANDGVLYVSTDAGLSFRLLPASSDPRFLGPLGGFGVDRRGSVYVSTLAGPFRSDDGGRSFRRLLNGFRASSVNDLGFDAEGKLLVAVQNTRGVFQQTHGLTYRPIGETLPRSPFGGTSVAALASSPLDARVVLAATSVPGGLFRTEDSGRTWMPASGIPPRLLNSRMAFPTADRAYLVLPVPAAFEPGLYRSDDAGRSFARLSSLRFGALAVDPNNPDVLYLGTFNAGEGLFKSTDGGQTLQSLGQPGFFSTLVVDGRDTRVVYAGEQFGQVIRSLDGGRTFAPASEGLAGEGVLGLAQDMGGTLYGWLRGGGLFASRDRAASWHPVNTGEALERSGVEAGRSSLVADPRRRGRLFLGNPGVIRIDADQHRGGHDDDD